ncbi:MAG TPA: CoB--CoM heterodisulfide reductase iron-sulfur subunit B family protein [Candidatus Choladousia intestinigallinarum]|nr:CoB--CoM heterodisulfide reductase iron-sulfur subunit B family protein [Candidatus Choladousia intestinigallinarum]
MKYSYYPGCTLKNKAKDLDAYARASARALGFELEEIETWQCCGGVYPLGTDEIATKLSSVRALNDAREKGQDLVTVCSACHHVIKRVNDDMKHVEDIQTRANNYLQLDEPYTGETRVLHYLEVLRDVVGFDELKKKVVNPLKGKKIGAYYGCLLLRPSSIMGFDNPENPKILEDFIRAIGAEPVLYPYRNECCGGYISLKEKEMAKNLCHDIVESAEGFGAEMLITACPLCMYNLKKSTDEKLPVVYFTELLAEALGVKDEAEELMKHAVDATWGDTGCEACAKGVENA